MFQNHAHNTVSTTGMGGMAFSNLGVADLLKTDNARLGRLVEIMDLCLCHCIQRRDAIVDPINPDQQTFKKERNRCKDKCSYKGYYRTHII